MFAEAFIAVLVFWFTFAFTPGPFWINYSQAAKDASLRKIVIPYLIYLLTFFFPLTILIAIAIRFIESWNEIIITSLYFIAPIFLFYLVYKMLKGAKLNITYKFGYKEMVLTNALNPKYWLTVPVGALPATFFTSDSITNVVLNGFIFGAVVAPIAIIAGLFWFYLAKGVYVIALNKMTYFLALCLVGYNIYLIYLGVERIIEQIG